MNLEMNIRCPNCDAVIYRIRHKQADVMGFKEFRKNGTKTVICTKCGEVVDLHYTSSTTVHFSNGSKNVALVKALLNKEDILDISQDGSVGLLTGG